LRGQILLEENLLVSYRIDMLRPTVLAIPIFAILIAAEALWSRISHSGEYSDRRDTWTNIFLGFMSVAWGALFGIFTAFVYVFFYGLAPFKFPADVWWSWVILFFVDDLAYYVFHRISHESRLFWNFHVVHHSSEQFNLSVAVRQSSFSGMIHWIFYAPLMLLGFAPWMFALMHGFNLIYQFWIHTKFVDRLGWFEKILNTPSHHRVHHGVNPEYIDKNYGGALIIWDRLFGSFVEEAAPPRFGLIAPLGSYNPLWINTHAWVEMWQSIKRQNTVFARLRCMFASPNMDINHE